VKADTVFLTVSEVLGLHSDQIREFGGAAGIRDQGLLESAVAQASTTYDGEYLHNGLFEMAAAYAFHIAASQPFLDGNKRTAYHSGEGKADNRRAWLRDSHHFVCSSN
jgi:death-on-curing protein